jgi:hypothetical protein
MNFRMIIIFAIAFIAFTALCGCSYEYPESFGGKLYYQDSKMTLSQSKLSNNQYEGKYTKEGAGSFTWSGKYVFTPDGETRGRMDVTLTKLNGENIGFQQGGEFDVTIANGKIVRMQNLYDEKEVWTTK